MLREQDRFFIDDYWESTWPYLPQGASVPTSREEAMLICETLLSHGVTTRQSLLLQTAAWWIDRLLSEEIIRTTQKALHGGGRYFELASDAWSFIRERITEGRVPFKEGKGASIKTYLTKIMVNRVKDLLKSKEFTAPEQNHEEEGDGFLDSLSTPESDFSQALAEKEVREIAEKDGYTLKKEEFAEFLQQTLENRCIIYCLIPHRFFFSPPQKDIRDELLRKGIPLAPLSEEMRSHLRNALDERKKNIHFSQTRMAELLNIPSNRLYQKVRYLTKEKKEPLDWLAESMKKDPKKMTHKNA